MPCYVKFSVAFQAEILLTETSDSASNVTDRKPSEKKSMDRAEELIKAICSLQRTDM